MASSMSEVGYSSLPAGLDEQPAKRQKIPACSRCRRRKQKCDGQRPCANCARTQEQCTEVISSTLLLATYETNPKTDHSMSNPVVDLLLHLICHLHGQVMLLLWKSVYLVSSNSVFNRPWIHLEILCLLISVFLASGMRTPNLLWQSCKSDFLFSRMRGLKLLRNNKALSLLRRVTAQVVSHEEYLWCPGQSKRAIWLEVLQPLVSLPRSPVPKLMANLPRVHVRIP